jgi:hypothetical protein
MLFYIYNNFPNATLTISKILKSEYVKSTIRNIKNELEDRNSAISQDNLEKLENAVNKILLRLKRYGCYKDDDDEDDDEDMVFNELQNMSNKIEEEEILTNEDFEKVHNLINSLPDMMKMENYDDYCKEVVFDQIYQTYKNYFIYDNFAINEKVKQNMLQIINSTDSDETKYDLLCEFNSKLKKSRESTIVRYDKSSLHEIIEELDKYKKEIRQLKKIHRTGLQISTDELFQTKKLSESKNECRNEFNNEDIERFETKFENSVYNSDEVDENSIPDYFKEQYEFLETLSQEEKKAIYYYTGGAFSKSLNLFFRFVFFH